MRKTGHCFFLLMGLLSLQPLLHAQSSSFLGDGMQDIVRRNQLLGKASPHAAFMINGFAEINTAIDSLYPNQQAKIIKQNNSIPTHSNHPTIQQCLSAWIE
jgi:hypothetical protein